MKTYTCRCGLVARMSSIGWMMHRLGECSFYRKAYGYER